ncbi:MAG: carboxypeptidase regulatory-like domain-containing protein [Bacteroidota bacterium]
MLQRISLLLALLLPFAGQLMAQDGKITGTVFDENGDPLAFATILVYQGDLFINGARSAEDGSYSIQPIEAGTYRIKTRYLTTDKEIRDVVVNTGQTRFLDISFAEGIEDSESDVVVIEEYKIPVFEKESPSGITIGQQEINSVGTRNTQSLVAISPGVYQADEGDNGISIRGARSNATVYYIDGQKVRGGANLPQAAIAQLQVFTGGTPAEFGDFTGGVVSITTAKPASRTSVGIEAVTSEFLDPYDRSLVAFNITGPILKKKETFDGVEVERPVLGYFVAAEGTYNGDRDPAAQGIFQLRDGVLNDLEQNPLQINDAGFTFISRANFIDADDFEPIDAKVNNVEERIKVLGRLDFQPSQNILIKAGGNVEFSNQDVWTLSDQMFTPRESVPNFRSNTYRGWVRFQQQFKGAENATLKNFFYSIQADYSLYQRRQQHVRHEDNYWDYGYIGDFNFDRVPFFGFVNDPRDPVSSSGYWRTFGYGFQNLTFDGSNSTNPLLANYNNFIFDFVEQNGIFNPFRTFVTPELVLNNLGNLNNLAFVQGLRNGSGPPSIYGLYSGVGSPHNAYFKSDFEQIRVTGQATAEIKSHNIKAGFEFEQRTERVFSMNARSLWFWARQYTNRHFANTLSDDPSTYTYVTRDGQFQDTVLVPNLYVGSDQTVFDSTLRVSLGLPFDGTDFINIDALGPDAFSLDMFSADEILAGGNGPMTYYGYTYTGERQDVVDAAEFFNDPQNRPMNAFRPTYISAFIQDKFEYQDIIFNLGLRVDRFDANQPVLRDPFSLYPTFTAGETAAQLGQELPGGVSNDYIAYVDDASNPSRIIGYRDGEFWFDENGAPVSSNTIATASGGRPRPHVKEEEVTFESFEDYAPQTVFMPRASFSFPISDVALFFAHYDVLSQRPGQLLPFQGSLLAGQLSDFAFLENNPTLAVDNPNLTPEITVDYEAGFRQKIGERSALSIQAFYREQRDMVRFRRFTNAYPFTYDTYGNLDFGTVKGMSISYDMRRTNGISVRGSYTLQFSDATGSSFSSARNVVQNLEGIGVLRVQLPTNFDQRHRIVGVIDYRFSDRRMGPGIKIGEKTFYPLKNFGGNLTMNLGSGTPFSQNAFATPSVVGGTPIVDILQGTPNGSRLPFRFRADLRLDKSFYIGGKEKTDMDGNKTKSREYFVNVYLLMLNMLNTENIIGVYRYTGLADDDGYLTSDIGQQDIAVQIDSQAFFDQYTARVQNPNFLSRPRTIQIGMNLNF